MKKISTNKIRQALYTGILPIGGRKLMCAVLDDDTRVLTATSIFTSLGRTRKGINDRLIIEGNKMPPFFASKNLKSYLTTDIIKKSQLICYQDGNNTTTGYEASVLPMVCSLYLQARRDGKLTSSQENIAQQAEILIESFAKVGINALIDEASGFQYDRKHDALRILLEKYINEGLQKWTKTFTDSFFQELDRLYNNETTVSQKRPQYYGSFINKYIYSYGKRLY